MVPEPCDVPLDRVHKLCLFLARIGIVIEKIALAAEFFRNPEIDVHALCMPDVQISVGLGRKTRLHRLDFARRKVFFNDLFNEIAGFRHISLLSEIYPLW